jgi:cold shock CspA family protein
MSNEMLHQLPNDRTTYTSHCTLWNHARGFGWIANPSPAGRDIFVHVSGLIERFRLIEGEIVSYQLKPNPKGPIAVNVRVLKSRADEEQYEIEGIESKETHVNATEPARR